MAGNDVFLRTIPSDADPDDVRLYDPNGVAGGDANFAGTATLTFAQTGGFTAGSALTGSIPIVFGQTGAFRGGAGFAGTIPIVVSQTGAFRGGAGLAGTATVTFGQSGAFSANSAYAGAATVTFGQSGDFVADGGAVVPPSGTMFGRSIKPTKVYRPFDREIEDIQSILEKATERPKAEPAKPKRKREIIRAVVAETVKAIEGEGLIANTAVRQEIKQAAFELIFPAFELPEQDTEALRAMIADMLQRAAEASYQQQVLEYEQMMAFEADEEDALCLLLA